MVRALVTGATGFVGQFFIPYLLEQGVSVRILVRNARQHVFPDKVAQHVGDLIDAASLKGVAEDIDIIFHLGGHAHAWNEGNEAGEQQHTKINFVGTQNILNEGIRAGVKKFIFFSTIKAVADSRQCIDEKWDAHHDTPYGKAKRAAEEWVLSQGHQHSMPVCVLRLALVYGPLLKGNLYQMLRAIDKGYFPLIPAVKNQRSLVSVYDVCQAAWLAANSAQANGKIYFVTDNKEYSTYDIYALMRVELGRPKPLFHLPLWLFKLLAFVGDNGERILRRRLPFNSQAFDKLFGIAHYSSLRIQQELGFCPHYSLQKLMPEIVQVYSKG